MNNKRTMISAILVMGLAAGLGAQTIALSAPDGGENWTIGSTATIVWSASGVATVRIVLFQGGTGPEHRLGNIAVGLPADGGSYAWTVGSYIGGTAGGGGNCYIRVHAESGSAADTSSAPFTLVSPLPNIHAGSMREIGWDHTFLPRTFAAGDTVTITYHLRNDSDFAAGPFHVGLRVGGTIVARQAVSELVRGADDSGEFTWTAACGSPVAVVADCDGEVAESNEADNVMTDPDLACSQPDLNFFSDLRCSCGTSTPKAGLPYEFSARIDSETARADNVRVVGGVVDGAVLYDHTFPVMPADGGIERVSFIWEVPEGARRVYFRIDPDNTVAESNERNNRQELAITGVASTPATEHYDLRVSIDRARSFGPKLGPIEVAAGRELTIYGEVRGATGAIRDFKVTGTVRVRGGMLAKIYEHDFIDPEMLAVPFSFAWTPDALGEATITVKASLGPHSVGVGVVDGNAANNAQSLIVNVVKPKPALR